MRLKWLSILVVLLAVTEGALAQGYIATPINNGSPIGFVNLIGLNNKGMVLGDACVSGSNCFGANRFPAVWSNGVFQALALPPGYVFVGGLGNYKINDSGMVVGEAQPIGASGNVKDVVVWQNGSPTVIVPPATLFPGCSGPSYSDSYALNSAGHVLIATAFYGDPSFSGSPDSRCYGFWIYPTASSRVGGAPAPLPCDGLPVGMNDADQVLEELDFCPGMPGYYPAVYQPNGSFHVLPAAGLKFNGQPGARPVDINNTGDVRGFGVDPSTNASVLVVWDGSGAHPFPAYCCGTFNNVGQVVYLSGFGGTQASLWQNGVSTTIQLPPNISPPSGLTGSVPITLNDAGQFTVQDNNSYSPGHGPYLLSPSGACGQDAASQTQVTRGGFRFSHASNRFVEPVSVTNTSSLDLTGPISLALDSLPAKASLFGINGATQCMPPQGSQYTNVALSSLAAGASVSATLQFINTEQSGVSYTTRIIAGTGRR